ncbi:hypothetical protein GUJ93_ZPchr0014g47489 [Zizania palustris]|uniref:Uncharacterized protein n=1 Tax=Zizania palustris TaxID=103762 RepID=A0A8J5W6P5_ZIZPA|nr:hypothetical protein GUJ93_ZPchr0014g47489 [Zizania palustris]
MSTPLCTETTHVSETKRNPVETRTRQEAEKGRIARTDDIRGRALVAEPAPATAPEMIAAPEATPAAASASTAKSAASAEVAATAFQVPRQE